MEGFAAGARCLLDGFGTWRTRPRLMLLGLVPALVVLMLLGAAFVLLLTQVGDLVAWATPFADDWAEVLRQVLRIGLGLVVVLGALVVASITFTGLTLTVGDPFYEHLWREAERDLGGPVPDNAVPFWRSALDSLVLVGIGLAVAVAVFVIGLLPFVGALVGATLGLVVSGRLLAGELLARPLEARGYDRRARRDLLRHHRGRVLGFGVLTQACFLVPLGGVAAMPAAVVGATRLARQVLEAAPPSRA